MSTGNVKGAFLKILYRMDIIREREFLRSSPRVTSRLGKLFQYIIDSSDIDSIDTAAAA